MKTIYQLIALSAIFCFFHTTAQAQVGNITGASTSCTLTIASCEGDTLTLTPQNQASYTNYRWYYGSVSPANEITAATAAARHVVATNFVDSFPKIKVTSTGGTYILTGDYAIPGATCSAINDTFNLNFTPRPTASNATLTMCEPTAGSNIADFMLTDADATVTGGAGGVGVTYYTSLADARTKNNSLSSPYISAAGTLYARVENTVTGCFRTSVVTLTINSKPVIADAAKTICNGETVNLTAQIVSYASYSNPTWTVATAGGTSVSTPTSVSPNTNTTYVLVADAGGCKDTAEVVVTVNPVPDFTLSKPVACPGTSEEVYLTIVANATIPTAQLSIDSGTFSGFVSPITGLSAAIHTVTLKNGDGCQTTKSITISTPAAQICLPVTVTRSN